MNLVELTQHTQSEEVAEEHYERWGYFKNSQNVLTAKEIESESFDENSSSVTPVERNGAGDVEAGLKSHAAFFKSPLAIKLFELETSVRKASRQLELIYNTTYGLYKLIRQIIIPLTTENKRFSGENEVDESYFGVR